MCNLYLCCGHPDVSEQSTLYMLRGTWCFSDINISLSCIISCLIYVSCPWPIREHPHVWKYSVGHIVSRWTMLWAGQPGNCCWIATRSQRFISSTKHPDCLRSPPSLLCSGFQGLLLGVKWPGHEADHSLSFSDEVKSAWSYVLSWHAQHLYLYSVLLPVLR